MSKSFSPDPRFGRARLRVLIMGAGAGIGLACARAFAASGAKLLLSDVDGPALKRVAGEVGGTALFCDVASEASVAVFAADVERSFGAPDVLINAAGRSYVRTLGTLRISRALLPMMKQGGGRKDIVNIAQMAPDADHGPFPYAASIRAFASLADALAENVRGSKVVVTTIMPHGVQIPDEEAASDLFIPARSNSLRRRFHCELSDCDSFAAKIASAADVPRAGRFVPRNARAATGPAPRFAGSGQY